MKSVLLAAAGILGAWMAMLGAVVVVAVVILGLNWFFSSVWVGYGAGLLTIYLIIRLMLWAATEN